MAFNPRGAISTAAAGGGIVPTVAALFSDSGAGKSWKHQKKFAQNAVQWRVADAVAAGLHPLAALGMPLASYSPEVVGGGDNGFADEVANMGANIARGMGAMSSPSSKTSAIMEALAVENAGLQNDKLRSEIALLNQPGSPPGVALPGDPIFGAPNMDPLMNKKLQDRHGEVADLLSGPHSVIEVMRQPGNMLDPAHSADLSKWRTMFSEFVKFYTGEAPSRFPGGRNYR